VSEALQKALDEGISEPEANELHSTLAEASVMREMAAVSTLFGSARMIERDGTIATQLPEQALLDFIAQRKDLPQGEAELRLPGILEKQGAIRVQLSNGEWVYELLLESNAVTGLDSPS